MTSHPMMFSTRGWTHRLREASWWRILVIWGATELFRLSLSFITTGALFLFVTSAQAQNIPATPVSPGEVLRYRVKWLVFELGTVEIRQLAQDSLNADQFLMSLSVHSAGGLPFIDLHLYSTTRVRRENISLLEESIVNGTSEALRTTYRYDRERNFVLMVDSIDGQNTRLDTLFAAGPCYDAVGLLMAARMLSGSGVTCSLPTLNDYSIAGTDLAFPEEREEVEVAAFSRPLKARRIQGIAHWVGTSFAGMNGEFRGWVTDDDAAIPLRAEVSIFLGSIVLELEHCERMNWHPDTIASRQWMLNTGNGGERP